MASGKSAQSAARNTRKRAPVEPPTAAAVPQPGGRPSEVQWLTIRGARHNNLKNVDVSLPLGRFVVVTGVSGSGKSSLINDILHDALARDLNGALTTPGEHDAIEGVEHLDKIIAIDQTPIGRTPRSNAATYIKVFDEIRDLFTRLPDAKLRGYKPGRFSFNVAAGPKGGGRCEACEGNGSNRIEMDFLADVWVTCPVCGGKRFGRETLQIQFKGKSIADILDMDVQTAIDLFDSQPRIRAMLETLHDVGLDYLKIGQPSTTLSGGEAQRIKLARELVKKPTGRTMYVLDEPTTGLHFEDIRKLLVVLHSFVDAGNSVVVIEHNLDVIKTADWLIDVGPEGGEFGGRIVAAGTPEELCENVASHTGAALREYLGGIKGSRDQGSEDDAEGKSDLDRSIRSSLDPAPLATSRVLVRGAREHNLKDLTIEFPRDQMTVCTGVSGSGKTSFAIDTVFSEGYRRYVESLSAYARQFLGQLQKPRVEHIEGLSPAICIEQKAASKSPRSTVGTITEIYDYMRVLWARVGTPFCPQCKQPIGSQTVDQIVDRVMALGEGTPIVILAPVALGDGETYNALFTRLKNSGYTRVRINGAIQETVQAVTLDARRKHRVEVVVDRTIVKGKSRGRISESVEHAVALGNGLMTLVAEAFEFVEESDEATERRSDAGEDSASVAPSLRRSVASPEREFRFSQRLACLRCGNSYEDLSPHSFSFNSQMGWCETCEGLGFQRGAPAESIIVQPDQPLLRGAIAGWGVVDPASQFGKLLIALCRRLGVTETTPLADWPHAARQALLYGTEGEWISAEGSKDQGNKGSRKSGNSIPRSLDPSIPRYRFHWRGFFPTIDNATRNSWALRHRLHNVVSDVPCITCRGGRLRPDAAAVRLVPNGEYRVSNSELDAQTGGAASELDADHSRFDASPTLVDICQWPLSRVHEFFQAIKLDKRQKQIAGELLLEIRNRLQFLLDVGLEYLTLHRPAPTLSGGEAQRIRLASQIGSGLSGVLYVLDEPTIGLHPRDTQRLVKAMLKLRALGNTLLLVEHDREVMAASDRILDFGPRAGALGGELVASGAPGELQGRQKRGAVSDCEPGGGPRSLTRAYLRGDIAIPVPTNRRPVEADAWGDALAAFESGGGPPRSARRKLATAAALKDAKVNRMTAARQAAEARKQKIAAGAHEWLVIKGARQNNLRNITVPIPLSRLVCVTGVSGSGKSSLVNDILWPALAAKLRLASLTPGAHEAIIGVEHLDAVINVDQSPIGTTPVSNPATYTGVFDWIRELFARLPDAKIRGWQPNRFSFNRPGGRCEACEGYGQKCIEMHFMPDVWVECEVCRGKRYNDETLQVRFKGKSIADVLEMRVSEAVELFENVPRVRRMLSTLVDVGLDYVQLGQPANTLSGGEAQRVKLAGELGKPNTGRTLYMLDEPTTGLHMEDVRKLLGVLHRLTDLGNSVIVVEHNLDVLKNADWIIDLGPEAGEGGGRVVAAGTPEAITESKVEGRRSKAEMVSADEATDSALDLRPLAFVSHTASSLAPVLAAGPHAAREVYDAAKHAEEEIAIERAGLGKVGREVKQPWQTDGRKWHLSQRTSRDGKPTRWEPAALEFVEKLVQGAGGGKFEPTNWNERASVEIKPAGHDTWFLHALTGGEWLLELYFRVPRGTFDAAVLNKQLGLKTLDQREDIESYGAWSRVDVRPRQGELDAVVIYPHDKKEIDTPAFRKFVKSAVTAFLRSLRK